MMTAHVASLVEVSWQQGEHQILNQVSLNIPRGKIVGLIGPSGSGKTSIIKVLLGMVRKAQGEATIFNTPMPHRKILERVGYMGQTSALYEGLTAYENLHFYGQLRGYRKSELKRKINASLNLVDLLPHQHHVVRTFSGGMKQRLSLAMTLLSDPDFMILDEPTVGIDPKLRQTIWQQLRAMTDRGHTILMTTHVMDEAERCDEIALVMNGKIFAYGTPAQLKEKFQTETIENAFIKAEEWNADEN